MWDEEAFFQATPRVRCGRAASTKRLSPNDKALLDGMYRLAGIDPGTSCRVMPVSCMWIGSMKLNVGSWFFCHPDGSSELLYFGHVQGLYKHRDGAGAVRAWVKATWYHTYQKTGRRGEQPVLKHYDPDIRCPLLSNEVYDHVDGPWFMAQGIVPWPCLVVDHPRDRNTKVALARHWHILRHFPSIPTPPWLV